MTAGVAVTGMGIVCALGAGVQQVEAALYGVPPDFIYADRLHPDALSLPFFKAPLSQRRHSAADTFQLGRQAACESMARAGWQDLKGAAVVAATTSGTALHFLESYKKGTFGQDCEDYMKFNPALRLGEEFSASGPMLTIANACASGADAIGLGMDLILSGMADKVLCGGMEAFSLVAHSGFARLLLYDDKPCKPFDADRKGLNLGEGAAFLCLEKTASQPAGYILGYSAHADAWHLTAPHPEGRGLRKAIRQALAESGLAVDDLAFVNAHGTGTRENDKCEGATLTSMLASVPVWASKGMTGHTLGAAGAIEAVLSLLALKKGKIPASAGFSKADENARLAPTVACMATTRKAALSVSIGFGGGNAALVVAAP